MRPAFSSRTNRRWTTALARALRSFFLMASDMWHLSRDVTRTRSALDRECVANTCHDIEWDDRGWNGCASSSLSCSAGFVSAAHLNFVHEGYFRSALRPVHRGALRLRTCGPREPPLIAPAGSCVPLISWRRIDRTNMQIGARPDKRRNAHAG